MAERPQEERYAGEVEKKLGHYQFLLWKKGGLTSPGDYALCFENHFWNWVRAVL